jgi:hypothetical protein
MLPLLLLRLRLLLLRRSTVFHNSRMSRRRGRGMPRAFPMLRL